MIELVYDIWYRSHNLNLTKECVPMRIVFFVGSCLMMIACVLVAVTQIKNKKSITDPYLLLAIITFLIALRTICRMLGV